MPLADVTAAFICIYSTNLLEGIMAWELLLTSDIGLLSLFTIGFILVMAVYLARYASRHIKDEQSGKNLPRAH